MDRHFACPFFCLRWGIRAGNNCVLIGESHNVYKASNTERCGVENGGGGCDGDRLEHRGAVVRWFGGAACGDAEVASFGWPRGHTSARGLGWRWRRGRAPQLAGWAWKSGRGNRPLCGSRAFYGWSHAGVSKKIIGRAGAVSEVALRGGRGVG